MQALTLDLNPIIDLTDEQFFQLCEDVLPGFLLDLQMIW